MSVYELINQKAYELIEQAESLCGKRMPEYIFHGVRFKDLEQPQTELSGKDLVIFLRARVCDDFEDACCECAHEIIHLISPQVIEGETTSTVLEEGLATYFQALICRDWLGRGFITQYCEYNAAYTLVSMLLKLDPHAIKKIRQNEPILARVNADIIIQAVPNASRDLAENLEKPLSQLKLEMSLS